MADRGRTHWESCYLDSRHKECAKANISELQRLARIGAAVVERVDEEGFTEEDFAACPTCGRAREFALAHEEGCPIARHLDLDTLG